MGIELTFRETEENSEGDERLIGEVDIAIASDDRRRCPSRVQSSVKADANYKSACGPALNKSDTIDARDAEFPKASASFDDQPEARSDGDFCGNAEEN